MKIKVPACIINILTNQISIDIDFSKATETVKQKVFKACINLWYIIYDTQITDSDCINLKYYTHISSQSLHTNQLTIKHNNQTFYYSKFLEILKAAALIEINEPYFKGSYTKSYRINTDFLKGTELTEVNIDFDLLTDNTRNKSYWLKKYPKHTELIKDCYRTKIDLDKYISWLNNNVGADLTGRSFKESWTVNGKTVKISRFKERILDTEKIMLYTNLAVKQNLGNLWFKVSNEGRFYNSFVNLSYTALPFVLLNKRKLKSIDISNSQPLLLASLVDNVDYKNDCGNGEFYNVVKDKMGVDKNEVKVLLFKYVFFTNKPLKGGKLYKVLDSLYPGLMQQINAIKAEKSLAHLLQTMEADIIVNGAGSLDFPKLLRHDQVLMFEENYNDVADYLKSAYRKIGLQVSFKP